MAIPDFLQQLLSMGPAIGAGVSGNGDAMSAFMEGFERARQADEQRKRLTQQDQFAQEDRQFQRSRMESQDQRIAEQDRIAAEERQRRRAVEGIEIPGVLAQQGAAMDSPEQAKALIESLMPTLMQGFGQEAMAFGQPAVEMAQQVITGRQKKAVEAFVEQAVKTSFVADNPDADPELINLPEHIQKIVGKPSARLSELQRYAALPVGRPVAPKSKPVSVSGRLVNPDDGTVVYEPPPTPEKPSKPNYRWLVQGDGEPFEWPDDRPAPRGARPYDQVAARKEPSTGQPSAYSVERATRTIQSVDELMGKVNRWTTGLGSVLGGVPETDARNFKAELDTLKANVAFNELTAMREASKTGGALGAVSDREMALLSSALGALDPGQSPQNIKDQLQKIKDSVIRWQEAQGMKPAVSHSRPAPGQKKNPFRP